MAALPEGWEVVPLESLLVHPKALTYGVVQPGKPQTDGVPIVRVGDIRQGRVDTISPMRIAPAVEASYERSRIEGGELLITLVGTVGEAAVAPVEMAGWNAARAVAVARVRPDVGSAWVCRALRLPIARDRIAARLNTTVQATLNLSDLRQVPVVLPPPEIRGEVARTADALDDRITSNLKAISLMEQLGSALLDEQLTFDEAGNMKVRALPLGDFLAVLETGSRPKGGVTASVEGVASLGAENVRPAGVGTANEFKRVSVEFAAQMRRGVLENEDVLVYKDGSALSSASRASIVGAYGFGFPTIDATINEHVYRVRARPDVSQALLYWLLRSPWMDREIRKRATGAAIPGLNSTNFRGLPMPHLSDEATAQLNEQLGPMFEAMLRRGVENRELSALSDTVLPELLAGRLGSTAPLEAIA